MLFFWVITKSIYLSTNTATPPRGDYVRTTPPAGGSSPGGISINSARNRERASVNYARNGERVNSFNQLHNSSNLKVKFFNSQCLYNKYTDLIDTVLSEDLDIVAICETWLDKSISNSEFEIRGYKTFRVDRSLNFYPEGTYSVEARGGVLLMIKD